MVWEFGETPKCSSSGIESIGSGSNKTRLPSYPERSEEGRVHLRRYFIWLVVWNMAFMTFHISGISSSQLTFTPSFFRGVGQPPTGHHLKPSEFEGLDLRSDL